MTDVAVRIPPFKVRMLAVLSKVITPLNEFEGSFAEVNVPAFNVIHPEAVNVKLVSTNTEVVCVPKLMAPLMVVVVPNEQPASQVGNHNELPTIGRPCESRRNGSFGTGMRHDIE